MKTLISNGPNKDIFDTSDKLLLQQTLPLMTAAETRANFTMVNKWSYLIHLMWAKTGQNIRLVISNPVCAVIQNVWNQHKIITRNIISNLEVCTSPPMYNTHTHYNKWRNGHLKIRAARKLLQKQQVKFNFVVYGPNLDLNFM